MKEDKEDLLKGKATQCQLKIWDHLLKTRIKMQKIIMDTNTLPQPDVSSQLVDNSTDEGTSKEFAQIVKTSSIAVQKLLDTLLDLQDSLILQNPEITKVKRHDSADSENVEDDNEEILSSEDDEKEEGSGTENPSEDESDHSETLKEEDEEEDESIEEEEEDSVLDSPSPAKMPRLANLESEVDNRWNNFASFRDETIQKWNDKTQVASGNLKRNFAAFQTSTLNQINHLLKDKDRLIKRTQMKRTQCSVIGKDDEENPNDSNVENDHDPEIYNDDDFYYQLLRQLIERKTSSETDPVQLSRNFLQIQKLRNKLKRNVDTRASKGRKIRYDVHPKLVNYMASYDNCDMSENAVKELMASLFGNQKSE